MTVKPKEGGDRFHYVEEKAGRELVEFERDDRWDVFQAYVNPGSASGAKAPRGKTAEVTATASGA